MNAVITAGARVDAEFARRIGTPVKALARVGGRTLLAAAIDAARQSGVTRLAVVGGSDVREACAQSVDAIIEESESGAANLQRALRAWNDEEPLLYMTSDMPFIDGAGLHEFIESAPPAALALPVTACSDFERRFPGAPPFGIDIGGERIVNGGVFWIPARAAPAVEAFAMRFFDARKSLTRMALLLGPVLCLRFGLRRLTIAALEKHARRRLGIPAVAIRGASPDLAYDIDTLDEYVYAEKIA
ncbi:MAG TPA: NTP transferase domain-containing protein [Candidatus Rubrimentiphilum sp.]|nr:NTP transferase domain-containing protein [Candidatus Rubrimentiphilum sp.]